MRAQRLRFSRALAALAVAVATAFWSLPASAQRSSPGDPGTYSARELVGSGHNFFGNVSRGLALTLQEATRRWGEPNGYILGQEGSGAVFAGLRFGEGTLYTRNVGQRRIYWQGPSLGFDVGGEGARSMMLVYNMQSLDDLYKRFVGIDGSAYFVGGFGMTAAAADHVIVVPIRSGVGLRLGVNAGYIKFSSSPTWNPF